MPGSQAGGNNPDYNLIEIRCGRSGHSQKSHLWRLDRVTPVQERISGLCDNFPARRRSLRPSGSAAARMFRDWSWPSPLPVRFAATRSVPRSSLGQRSGCAGRVLQGRQAAHDRLNRSNSRVRGWGGAAQSMASSLSRDRASRNSCGSTLICSVMPAVVICKTSAVCRQDSTVSVSSLSSSRSTL